MMRRIAPLYVACLLACVAAVSAFPFSSSSVFEDARLSFGNRPLGPSFFDLDEGDSFFNRGPKLGQYYRGVGRKDYQLGGGRYPAPASAVGRDYDGVGDMYLALDNGYMITLNVPGWNARELTYQVKPVEKVLEVRGRKRCGFGDLFCVPSHFTKRYQLENDAIISGRAIQAELLRPHILKITFPRAVSDSSPPSVVKDSNTAKNPQNPDPPLQRDGNSDPLQLQPGKHSAHEQRGPTQPPTPSHLRDQEYEREKKRLKTNANPADAASSDKSSGSLRRCEGEGEGEGEGKGKGEKEVEIGQQHHINHESSSSSPYSDPAHPTSASASISTPQGQGELEGDYDDDGFIEDEEVHIELRNFPDAAEVF